MKEDYEEQLKNLREKGMFYYGVKKKFVGKVDDETFFNEPALIINTFGYYHRNDTWSVFITDEERGIENTIADFSNEENAVEYLMKSPRPCGA